MLLLEGVEKVIQTMSWVIGAVAVPHQGAAAADPATGAAGFAAAAYKAAVRVAQPAPQVRHGAPRLATRRVDGSWRLARFSNHH